MKRLILAFPLLLLAAACQSAPTGKPQASVASARPAGACSTNEQCGEGEFCAKLFGSCDESGLCEPRPESCVEHGHVIDKPVCGCDGKTYGNYCLAAASGVNVRSEGPCTAP
ncbi:MAG: Kazal domain-containing protein [Acidobacteriota bacterium]